MCAGGERFTRRVPASCAVAGPAFDRARSFLVDLQWRQLFWHDVLLLKVIWFPLP